MPTMIDVRSRHHNEWIEITEEVQSAVNKSGLDEGVVTVFVPHTTAAVTIQENADPPLKADIAEVLDRLFPWNGPYKHGEDNAAAHMKAVLTGTSERVPFSDGKLLLGTWQSIYFCEFDGPRRRRVVIHVSP